MLPATLIFLLGASLQGPEQGYPHRCPGLPIPSFQDQLKPSSYRKSSLTTPAPLRLQRCQKTGVLAPNLQRRPSTCFCLDLKCSQFWLLACRSCGRRLQVSREGISFSSAAGLQTPQALSFSPSLSFCTGTSSLIQGCLGL